MMNEFQHSKELSEVDSMYQWLQNQSINQGPQMLIHINGTYIEEVLNVSLPLGEIGDQDLMA
jgi:hypothetical protein